jgi:ABC-2 type transport system permease protein
VSAPWAVIARREFLERVRTKWFLIGTLLGPIGMVALIVIPAVLANVGQEGVRIKVVDHTGRLGGLVATTLGANEGWKVEDVPAPADPKNRPLLDEIRDEKIDGFIVIPANAMVDGTITYQGDNATNQSVVVAIFQGVSDAVRRLRAADVKITREQVDVVMAQVRFKPRHTTGEEEGTSGFAAFAVGYALMLILYMAIVLYGMNVMRSVVQEKTSRIVELMVAAAKPRALMAGKILGVGAVGLVQLTVWLGMAWLTVEYRDSLLGTFGVEGAGGFSIPSLRASEIAVALIYFILGYFFYASLYAAVGAMVSTEQEAQQAQTPVILLLIIPMVCMQLVANDPRGPTAELMTMLPFSSPILMPMRYLLGGASVTQLLLSIAILAASTAVVAIVAARIYRVGILMYGKRPSLRELLRWLRY